MYSFDEKVLIWLNTLDGISYKKKEVLLNHFKTPGKLYENFEKEIEKVISITDEKTYELLKAKKNTLEREIEFLDKNKITAVTFFSKNYPESLKNIDSPPLVLSCKGDVSLLNSFCFAVVGSRKVSGYGKVVTEKFTSVIARNGLTIVSGLASGVDTIAHQSTLNVGGKTIAVLAGGFCEIYPSFNVNLAKRISEEGLLVTEYSYYEKAEAFHFPLRNRIIAGLSRGVLITEAGERSGSMHTKNYAIDYGKDLFLVPGEITSSYSIGCNNAIKKLQGAMVTSPDDILELYNLKGAENSIKKVQLSMEEDIIFNLLKAGECSFQEISDKTKIPPQTLNSLLTTMQINGIIKKLAGNVYII